MNRIIKLLMISDIFVITGFGLIEPILSIFIKEDLIGGSVFAAGFASTLFLVTKSLVQLPFSKYVDSHKHKIRWLILGTLIISTIPFIYIFAKDVKFIYLAQILYGLGAGFAYPTWLGLWSTHLDKNHESFEWSLYSTAAGLGTALTAAVGAVIASLFGFAYTFAIVGVMSLVGAFILFKLEKESELKRKTKVSHTHYHIKRKLINHRHH